jgi:agmatine/peptidylarginine deiminase
MTRLPAEWEPQSFVQFTFPHQNSDWADTYEAVVPCFVEIIATLAKFQPVLVGCHNVAEVRSHFRSHENMTFVEVPSNDTWARDHGAITVLNNDKPVLLDFIFTGWGLKFPAHYDNLITRELQNNAVFGDIERQVMDIALEGGAIESDGMGTILTTSECLLSPNRNPYLDRAATEVKLKEYFGAEQILWLDHGYLAGDDTDSHIDTLARLCNPTTIAYVQCSDPDDEHFEGLYAMEQQLMQFTTTSGKPYQLVALPMADACYGTGGERLPTTYANFLIANGVVLVPTYQVPQDDQALTILRSVFPNHEVIGINCLPLIEQHGSLHCITMQYPEQVSLKF